MAASVAVALALAVSACGASGSGSRRASTGTAPQSTTSSTSTTTATAASDKRHACTTNQLRSIFDRTTGAAGSELLVFSVRDTSTSPCALAGYFGIRLLSSTGRLLTSTDHHTAETPGGVPASSETVTLEPGGEATTATSFSNDAPTGSGATCNKVATAQLIPPTGTGQRTVRIPRSSQPLICGARAPIDVFVTRPGPPPANYR